MKTISKTAFLIILMSCLTLSAQNTDKAPQNIAKNVMKAMGGIDNYNNTHFIQWNFAKRTLYWNKWTGDVRVESPEKNLTILLNINTNKGKVYENGTLLKNKEEINKFLKQGKEWWINDSYWLVMPWKLLDNGVTLSNQGTSTLPNGNTADVLQMTFESVGVTPENKYLIYVDQQEHLVKQWAYFKNFKDAQPKFTLAWNNYQQAGDILLSFNRLNGTFGPTDVLVKTTLDPKLFNEL